MENNILAIVNGLQIKESDVEDVINRLPQDRRAYVDNPTGREQLLQQIISFELMYLHGKEQGIENSEAYKNQVERLKKEILTQVTIDNVLSKVAVEDQEAKKFYDENEDKFVDMEQVRAKHILVDSEEKAKEVANLIQDGLTFEEAAEKYSSCPSNAQGGDLGFFTRGKMVPEFEDAAFSLKVGEISEPVKTQFGYHLVKVEEKKEARNRDYKEVEHMIKNNLLQQKQAEAYGNLTEELKKKYKVEFYR